MQTSTSPNSPFAVPFTDPLALELARVGGKGANLARLASAGLPVPDGFCVTTAAYHALIATADLQQALQALEGLKPEDTEAVSRVATALREQINSCPLPETVQREVEQALAACGPEYAYAVRSSATAEDLPEASFAGQQDTYLNVRGAPALMERIRACMASLFTERAIVYRARNGIPHSKVANAVVVQRMISPEVSGILFTADPVSGHRKVVAIDAGFGLGEALVSGRVTADLVRADKASGRVLEYRVGDKHMVLRALPGGGTQEESLPPEQRSARVLSEEEVRMLVELGRKVEELQGEPQDVEWSREAGCFYLLQARPITSLFPLPSPIPQDGKLHVYWSVGHKQSMIEAMPPLVTDLWLHLMPMSMGAKRDSPECPPWVVTAGGRLYSDLTPMLARPWMRRRTLARMALMDEPSCAVLAELALRPEIQGAQHPPFSELLGVMQGGVTRIPSALLFESLEDAAEREQAWIESHVKAAVTRIRSHRTPQTRLRSAVEELRQFCQDVVQRAYSIFAGMMAQQALQRLFPEESQAVEAISRGFEEDAITRMNLALGDVADVARGLPAVAEALRAGRKLEEVLSVEGGSEFQVALEEFLSEYGFRAWGEIDLSRPRWREDPTPLLQVIRGNLAAPHAGAHREQMRRLVQQSEEATRRLEERARQGLMGPVRQAMVRRLIRVARVYLGLREHPKYGLALLFAETRTHILEAGRQLVAAGTLGSEGDVWFLELEELLEVVGTGKVDRERLAERRRAFARDAKRETPRVITSEGEIPTPRIDRGEVPEGALVGTPVGGGVIEGTAHVVHDPGSATIEKGEILVAPYCDPGWTPLFLNAAGLVVDVGGLMTHGSIVAREYGLPAVVSVTEATSRIRTGQRIRVDGTRGFVQVLG